MLHRTHTKSTRTAAPMVPAADLSVGYLLGRARMALLSGLDAELARFGATGMQFAVLKHLAEGSAHTAADLCRYMHYDTGAMTRILDRLEQKGWVRRERSRADRRAVVLRLAPSGRAQLPRLAAAAAQVLQAHLDGLSVTQVEALKSYLGRMIANGAQGGENQQVGRGSKS